MAISRMSLKKFIKLTNLIIIDIDDQTNGDNEVLVLNLAEPVNATGSLPLPDGNPFILRDQMKVYVGKDAVEKFLAEAEELPEAGPNGETIKYQGNLKLDCSKPRFANNDTNKVIKPARIWLTTTLFSVGGQQLQRSSREEMNNKINEMFSGISAVVNTAANAVHAPAVNVVAEEEE